MVFLGIPANTSTIIPRNIKLLSKYGFETIEPLVNRVTQVLRDCNPYGVTRMIPTIST